MRSSIHKIPLFSSLVLLGVSAIFLGSSTLVFAGGTTMAKLSTKNPGKSLAVVSISANNWGNSLQGWNSANSSDLMGTRLNDMLQKVEALMGKDWKIVPASSFVGKEEFQALAGEQREVGVPTVDGKKMPLLSKNRKQLIKAQLNPEVVSGLAKVTGADFYLVVYSEWTVATGSFVPTSKSLAKNVVSIYDSKGSQVYKGRSDQKGNRNLGAFGRVVVDEDTIDQWVVAYQKGIDALFNAKRKKKK